MELVASVIVPEKIVRVSVALAGIVVPFTLVVLDSAAGTAAAGIVVYPLTPAPFAA